MSRRVTMLINSLRGGGAERVCATLANELFAAGWNVEVLVLNLRNAVVRDALVPGIAVIDLGVDHVRTGVFAIARHIRRNRPERFLVFNHQLAVLLVWLRALGVGRFAIVARNISTLSRKAALEPSFWHSRVVHALTRGFLRRVDMVIAQSWGMKQDLLDNYGVDEHKLRVIYNPLAPRFDLPRGAAAVPWAQRRDEILYVGRLAAIKGLELLIDACAICMRERPGLTLSLVGTGEQERELSDRVRRAGIAGRVTCSGYVADTVPYYARAKVVAMTSHYEGFPNVLVEALSQGTPIVSVDCASGPSEIVQDGRNGFLCRSREPADFASCLQRVLDREWDVDSVRQTVDRFSSREIAGRYARVLSESGVSGGTH